MASGPPSPPRPPSAPSASRTGILHPGLARIRASHAHLRVLSQAPAASVVTRSHHILISPRAPFRLRPRDRNPSARALSAPTSLSDRQPPSRPSAPVSGLRSQHRHVMASHQGCLLPESSGLPQVRMGFPAPSAQHRTLQPRQGINSTHDGSRTVVAREGGLEPCPASLTAVVCPRRWSEPV